MVENLDPETDSLGFECQLYHKPSYMSLGKKLSLCCPSFLICNTEIATIPTS